MKNKVTFFRFLNSRISVDNSIIEEEDSEKNNYEKIKNNLSEFTKNEFKELTIEENEILNKFNKEKVIFQENLNYSEKRLLEKIIHTNGYILKPTDEHNLSVKRFYERINKNLDISLLNKALIQRKFNQNSLKLTELKSKIEKRIPHERIEIKDINELNKIIEKENENGWKIQQIEGIQSAHYNHRADSYSGYGYGYSFTEGIMIVWNEK